MFESVKKRLLVGDMLREASKLRDMSKEEIDMEETFGGVFKAAVLNSETAEKRVIPEDFSYDPIEHDMDDLYRGISADYNKDAAIEQVIMHYPEYFNAIFQGGRLRTEGSLAVSTKISSAYGIYCERRFLLEGGSVLEPTGVVLSGTRVDIKFKEVGLVTSKFPKLISANGETGGGETVGEFKMNLRESLNRIDGLRELMDGVIGQEMHDKVMAKIEKEREFIQAEEKARNEEHYGENWGKYS